VNEPDRDRNGWRRFTNEEVARIEQFARTGQDGTRVKPGPLGRLRSLDWDFTEAKTDYLTHGLHPYPAKFIPQIPNALIQELSSVGDVVGDIFCGSGTTLVEALLLKRHAVGVDASPLACLISNAKTTRVIDEDVEALQDLATRAESFSEQIGIATGQRSLFAPSKLLRAGVPDNDAIRFWFEPAVAQELAQMRAWTSDLPTERARLIGEAAFSAIVVAVSRQDSDTRYVRRQKAIRPGDALARFARSLTNATRAAIELTSLVEPRFRRRVLHADVLEAPPLERLDLVVCSPPYPNAYSYHLYHMTRMVWLEMDQPGFKEVEIGSHRKYSRKGPGAATSATFAEEMSRVFGWLKNCLRRDGYACFVAGNSTIRGKRFNNADAISRAAADHGFIEETRLQRRLLDTRKAFNPSIGKVKRENIVILRNGGGNRT
jgi:site-specific DNA-methyltransferase (cytosine-N4-specific)